MNDNGGNRAHAPEATTAKEDLRDDLLARREALSAEEVARSSRLVFHQLRQLDRWRNARRVLLYWPVNNEVDTRPLMTELWGREAEVWLPRCRKERPGVMDLARVRGEEELIPGVFSIPEPGPECRLAEGAADLVLVPGVGYDRQGYRIGYGGGYYDRLLCKPEWTAALTVGLAHDFQVVELVPHDPWDVPVHVLAMPEELLEISCPK